MTNPTTDTSADHGAVRITPSGQIKLANASTVDKPIRPAGPGQPPAMLRGGFCVLRHAAPPDSQAVWRLTQKEDRHVASRSRVKLPVVTGSTRHPNDTTHRRTTRNRLDEKHSEAADPVSQAPTRTGPLVLTAELVASSAVNAMYSYASSPGNQVFFETATRWCHGAGPLGKVTISGANQYGKPAVWSGFPGDGHSVTTTKWWWVGNITVSTGDRMAVSSLPRT